MKKLLAWVLTAAIVMPSCGPLLPAAWAGPEAVRLGSMDVNAGLYGGQGSAGASNLGATDMANPALWESVAAGAGAPNLVLPRNTMESAPRQQIPVEAIGRTAGVLSQQPLRPVEPTGSVEGNFPERTVNGVPFQGSGSVLGSKTGAGEGRVSGETSQTRGEGLLPGLAGFVEDLAPKGKDGATAPLNASRAKLNGRWDGEMDRGAEIGEGVQGSVLGALKDAPSRSGLNPSGSGVREEGNRGRNIPSDFAAGVLPSRGVVVAAAVWGLVLGLPGRLLADTGDGSPNVFASLTTGDWGQAWTWTGVAIAGLGAWAWRKYSDGTLAADPDKKAWGQRLFYFGAGVALVSILSPYLAMMSPAVLALGAAALVLGSAAGYLGYHGKTRWAWILGGGALAAVLAAAAVPHLTALAGLTGLLSVRGWIAAGLGLVSGILTYASRRTESGVLKWGGVLFGLAAGITAFALPYLIGLWEAINIPGWTSTAWALIMMGTMALAPFISFSFSRRMRRNKVKALLASWALLAPFFYFSYHKPAPGDVQVVETRWGGRSGPYGMNSKNMPVFTGVHFTIPLLQTVQSVDVRPMTTQNTVVIPAEDLKITVTDQRGTGKRVLKAVRVEVNLKWSVGPDNLLAGLDNLASQEAPDLKGVTTKPKTSLEEQIPNAENRRFYERVIGEIQAKLRDDFLKVIDREKARGNHLNTPRMIQVWNQVRREMANSDFFKTRAKELYDTLSIDLTQVEFNVQLETAPLPK